MQCGTERKRICLYRECWNTRLCWWDKKETVNEDTRWVLKEFSSLLAFYAYVHTGSKFARLVQVFSYLLFPSFPPREAHSIFPKFRRSLYHITDDWSHFCRSDLLSFLISFCVDTPIAAHSDLDLITDCRCLGQESDRFGDRHDQVHHILIHVVERHFDVGYILYVSLVIFVSLWGQFKLDCILWTFLLVSYLELFGMKTG